jgi:hypothetical protein
MMKCMFNKNKVFGIIPARIKRQGLQDAAVVSDAKQAKKRL